jgi:ribonucleotide reductase alpha subunit
MRVIKRDNTYEDISFDKVLRRIRKLCDEGVLLTGVRPDEIAQKVCARIYDGVKTSELDELAAQMCATLVTTHPDYGILASRIVVSNHHKNTSPSFSETISALYGATDVHGQPNPLISEELHDIVKAHKEKLNIVIDNQRDYDLDYFGFQTLERSYLLKIEGKVVERPQHMWMRVALGIHAWDIKEAIETYEYMSRRMFTHATPTLFNAGTPRSQLASCFLLGSHDSVTGMYKTIGDCAQISKYAGGIGVHIHDIRAKNSHIRGTNGTSSGIIPMLRVYNNTARHINQAGKRLGSIAMYLEPWHADIEAFLDVRKNSGSEEDRCRDLFTAMWTPDLFMERVHTNDDWSLMCPDECPGLSEAVGEDFNTLYTKYESEGRARKKIKAQTLWIAIIKSQIETGTPYLCYKDAANKKSNQKNLGTIKSSNLCVAPETKVLTDTGYKVIKDIAGHYVNVWNGSEWSETCIVRTSNKSELLKVTFNNGNILECTAYHKFYVQQNNPRFSEMKMAAELEVGDILIKWTHPTTPLFDKHDIIVTSIERTGRHDETYCFNEPKRHMGVFNGVITGNCSEIIEYSDNSEYATCNLASISLPSFVKVQDNASPTFDHDTLHKIAQVLTRNLNKVIDRTFYPVPETRVSNLKHRPIGIGVQGLADAYALMRYPFDSPEAAKLNREIFETIYHGALTASMKIAKKRNLLLIEMGHPNITQERLEQIHKELNMIPDERTMTMYGGAYSSFMGSPASQGLLQFDLWGKEPEGRWDWVSLKEDIASYGLRNSLLLAPMPTASTSQILGNTECFEPITSNIFQRQSLAGDFTLINKHLVKDLIHLDLWSVEMKDMILASGGSIQHIEVIPLEIRNLYKTVWELKQKILIDQAADRGIYVCQSQSLNLFVEDPDISKISNMHFYAWRQGLKTGCYYLRSRPRAKMAAFTLSPPPVQNAPNVQTVEDAAAVCRRENPEACTFCSG